MTFRSRPSTISVVPPPKDVKAHQVIDPELGIDVIDLGLVYGIEIDELGRAIITMTLTAPACPLTDLIEDECASTLAGLVEEFRIDWTWQPRWTMDKITPEGARAAGRARFQFRQHAEVLTSSVSAASLRSKTREYSRGVCRESGKPPTYPSRSVVTMIPLRDTVMPSGVTVKPRARSFSVSMPTVEFSVSTTFLSRIALSRGRDVDDDAVEQHGVDHCAHEWMRTFGDSTDDAPRRPRR